MRNDVMNDIRTRLPNFLCVGTQKAATTTLDAILRQHPDIYMPIEKKELMYFDRDDYQIENYPTYCAYFEEGKNYKMRGEITPGYLYLEEVPGRIYDLLGENTKIIILLRHPIDRALSGYKHMSRHHGETLTFKEAFYADKERVKNRDGGCIYFDRGLYSNQVKRYMDIFPNTKVLLFEDILKNSVETMKEVWEFLGVDEFEFQMERKNQDNGQGNLKKPILKKKLNKIYGILGKSQLLKNNSYLRNIKQIIESFIHENNQEKSIIDDEFRTVLKEYYYEDICELEKLISRDLSAWK